MQCISTVARRLVNSRRGAAANAVRHCATLLIVILVCIGATTQSSQSPGHWRETDSEAIWTGRYSDCDFGYSVILPAGIVAHSAKSTGPNHGFAINPAAPRSARAFKTPESDRYIEVLSFYDLEDHEETTSATIDYYLWLGEIGGEKNVESLSRRTLSLAGLSAKRIETRWMENSTAIRRDRIIAYRRSGGILYQLTLQSPEKTYANDEQLFDRIVEGFRLNKLPTGECSNN